MTKIAYFFIFNMWKKKKLFCGNTKTTIHQIQKAQDGMYFLFETLSIVNNEYYPSTPLLYIDGVQTLFYVINYESF